MKTSLQLSSSSIKSTQKSSLSLSVSHIIFSAWRSLSSLSISSFSCSVCFQARATNFPFLVLAMQINYKTFSFSRREKVNNKTIRNIYCYENFCSHIIFSSPDPKLLTFSLRENENVSPIIFFINKINTKVIIVLVCVTYNIQCMKVTLR
jgi:hypothetical protein